MWNAKAPHKVKTMIIVGRNTRLVVMLHFATLGIIVFVLADQSKSTRFTWKPKTIKAPWIRRSELTRPVIQLP